MALERKQQQMAVLAIGGGAVAVLAYLVFGVLAPKPPDASFLEQQSGQIDVSLVADRTSAAAPEMSWVARSRADLENLNNLVTDMRETMAAERQERANEVAQLREEYDEIIVQQAQKIAALEEQAVAVAEAQVTPAAAAVPPGTLYEDTGSEFINRRSNPGGTVSRPALAPAQRGDQPASAPQGGATVGAGGFGQSFNLIAQRETEEEGLRTPGSYLPAGSYAPAVVLSGADAATNVVDRENPIPVLFRITGPAVTAAAGGGRGLRINIEGCTVQGSAIGDLSSERVRVRLLSLTCVRRDGAIMESEISGYMVGAGKAGVRGRVVSREGPMVANAALAGALEGLASVASSQGEADTETVQEMTRQALAAAGAGSLETAATTLSNYYVNRAEQYQPVIALNGGTNVELVFMEGVSLE
jgi:conjugal transfer pilus assembly protein TraB